MFPSFSWKVIIMKTMRFLVALAIVTGLGLGVAGSVGAAEKMGRKAATPAVEKAERKAAAKPVKKEKGGQKKATSDAKVEAGKKPAAGKSTGGRKKAA